MMARETNIYRPMIKNKLNMLVLVLMVIFCQHAVAQTNLPIPRMVSVKSEGVNVRTGPGIEFEIKWVFTQQNMPVEIIAEYENWRKIRDWDGAEGWIFHTTLSSQRAIIVKSNESVLRRLASDNSPAVARPTSGVVGLVKKCESTWCFVNIQNYQGWIKRAELWGLYPGEIIE